MSIFVLGINHKTAPVKIREQLTFTPEQLPLALRELAALTEVNEGVIVSTCNRTEVWCALAGTDSSAVTGWLGKYRNLDDAEIRACLYEYRDASAVRHLFRVACGLDSLVLGEPQILGQLKQAYRDGIEAGTIGAILSRAFQHSFSVAKQVRTDTGIGASPVSIAYAAVSLARQIFADFPGHTALLIGAGDTIELTARHLRAQHIGRLIIANRSLERATVIAERFDGYAIRLDALPAHLDEVDILISATASPVPVITRDQVRAVLGVRKHRPMFIVDLAVPRDVEPSTAKLEDVYLYTVDNLESVIEDGLRSRRAAADEATQIIDLAVEHFTGVLRGLGAVDTIITLRETGGRLRDEVLAEAVRMLERGDEPEQVAHWIAHTLTNKLLHEPTVRLRDAGARGDRDTMEQARKLFGLQEE